MDYHLLQTFRQEASRTAASVAEIHRHVGGAERVHPQSTAVVSYHIHISLIYYFVYLIGGSTKKTD